MPQYLLAGYLPDNFDPSTQDEASVEAIHALNREMIAAGVRKLACGLVKTVTLRAQPDGEVLITDGPYLEAKEWLAGYYAIETDTPERAYELAGQIPDARYFAIEVRPLMNYSGMEM